jgi:hypothetical protein
MRVTIIQKLKDTLKKVDINQQKLAQIKTQLELLSQSFGKSEPGKSSSGSAIED